MSQTNVDRVQETPCYVGLCSRRFLYNLPYKVAIRILDARVHNFVCKCGGLVQRKICCGNRHSSVRFLRCRLQKVLCIVKQSLKR